MQSGNEAMQCLYAFAVSVGFIAYKVIKSVKAFRGVGVADLFAYGRYAGVYDYPYIQVREEESPLNVGSPRQMFINAS